LNTPAIATESGPVMGIASALINEYLGIPYAAPPVGALRWTPPQSFGRWQGVLQATQFGSECPQDGGGDENCLFLNVYAPNVQTGQDRHNGLPVMVWIHGGGLTSGVSSDFDPTPLMQAGGVIVVTINYRLGILGFFAHPAIDGEGHLAGNYGLMDQQFALGWVQRNIGAFGGDATRVTIFGESAGGLSVYSQLASPLAAGLFSGAIAQSGAYAGFAKYRPNILPLAVAETTGNPFVEAGTHFASRVGCSSQTADCLRGLDAAPLVAAEPQPYPFIDGALLTQQPGQAFASGNFNRVPVITGTNHDEYRFFVARDFNINTPNGPVTAAKYVADLGMLFGPPLVSAVLGEYPQPPSSPVSAAPLEFASAGTDGIFACPARRAMESLSNYVTVYAYEFDDESAPSPFPPLPYSLGAYHGSDVQYFFNRMGVAAPFTQDQQKLSQAMVSYWTQFAKTGNPNSAGRPVWSPYDASTDLRQSFVPPVPGVTPGFAADHSCGFWDSF
jgi:para-nitrobenzyl esterase